MSNKTLLVTGSSGLIGSEVCAYFAREGGFSVHGIDNNQRAVFFGPQGDNRAGARLVVGKAGRTLPGSGRERHIFRLTVDEPCSDIF